MPRPRRFRDLFGPDPRADIDEELAFHLEMRAQELVDRGEAPDRARDRASARLGDLDGARRECIAIDTRSTRHMARLTLLSDLSHDVRFAWRVLRRSPGLALTAILTLALGIGATTAIYGVVHAVLVQPLPYPAARQLYVVQMHYPDGTRYDSLSAPDFMSVRQHARALEQVEALDTSSSTLVGAGEPREVRTADVSDGLLRLLGISPMHGRAFLAEEHRPGRELVAVLDHGFWLRAFGGDLDVVGRTVTIGRGRYQIVGVLPAGVRLPVPVDVYRPLAYGPTFDAATADGRRSEFLTTIGRARPGVDDVAVRADLVRIGGLLQQTFTGTNARLTMDARSLTETLVGDVRSPLLMLMGAVGFVLLVACANVAHLLLARMSARRAELGVRAALGATRGRIVRQLVVESLLLGAFGGLGGLVIASIGTRVLVAAQPADIPRLDGLALTWPVMLVGLASALAASLLLGLLPAWQSTGRALNDALREGGRDAGASGGSRRTRAALVVAEVGLAVVLLTGAGLFLRSLMALSRVDPGFEAEQVVAFRLSMTGEDYERGEDVRRRVETLLERLRAMPGTGSAAVTSVLPLSGLSALNDFAVEGQAPPPPHVNQEIAVASVSPEYFATIGTPITRGRAFTIDDRSEGARVALINEAGVRQWFGGRNPVGRRVLSGGPRHIVGVVGDVRQRTLGEPVRPQLFVPYAQRSTRAFRVVVRGEGTLAARTAAIRQVVRGLDPNLALTDVTPLVDVIDASLARPRFYTALLAVFAGVGLALAATGVFGVMSYAVSQRSQELGIRLALGALPAAVLRLVMRQSLALTAAGLIAGLAGAVLLARAVQRQLYEVTPLDPLTIVAVVTTLAVTAVIASAIPARRAARLDPARSLRGE